MGRVSAKPFISSATVGEYKCSQGAEYQFGDIVGNIGDSVNLPTVSDSTIKRDKTLAQVKSANIEIKLIDIFGKISQLKDGDSSFLLRCGCWVALSEDGLRAISVQSGYPGLSIESKLYIFPVVNVIADADIRFGQIDPYASLNVSGVLTGAYPVNAGQIKAVEIRGATVSSIGDISVDVGIIGSKIKTQGSVRAKYIHNSRIEAFGDVFVEHEIIDSTIIISGECNVSAGRVVASKIFAKMGVKATRIGSNITEPCYINVGCEEHIALKLIEINRQINKAQKELDDLILEKEVISQSIKELFKKMVKIKGSYDQIKSNFVKLSQEINIDSQEKNVDLEVLKDEMDRAVEELKANNQQKRDLEIKLEKIEKSIVRLKPKITQEIMELKIDRGRFIRWAESNEANPEIKVFDRLSDETIVKTTTNQHP
ncbi:MAG: DUF342 domain-containing protein [Desulfamplus sp.]|nr:DUF342 domain-containing protein [Desulfamplus sp.]